jgi:uncharacterized protein YyaL (SSP411 family)
MLLGPMREIAIVGDPAAASSASLRREVFQARYLPNAVIALSDGSTLSGIPLLQGKSTSGGEPTAFVCDRFACRAPVTDAEDLKQQLEVDAEPSSAW